MRCLAITQLKWLPWKSCILIIRILNPNCSCEIWRGCPVIFARVPRTSWRHVQTRWGRCSLCHCTHHTLSKLFYLHKVCIVFINRADMVHTELEYRRPAFFISLNFWFPVALTDIRLHFACGGLLMEMTLNISLTIACSRGLYLWNIRF